MRAGSPTAPTLQMRTPAVRKRHISWALKAVLPIAAVLLNGLLLFVLVSLSLDPRTSGTSSSPSPPRALS